jgi:hypothetical protein
MASEGEGVGGTESNSISSGISVTEAIRLIAAKNARAKLDTEEQLRLFLESWWSKTYNRPLKDPLLQTYTLEELLYEFYDKIERREAELEREKEIDSASEEAKEKQDLDWAESMEKQELEEMKAKAAKEDKKRDPAKDPQNIKWMEEQVRLAKTEHGTTFGEDIDESFDE